MTPEQRQAAWQRCEQLRHEIEKLLSGDGSGPCAQLAEELDQLEDRLSVDLIEMESGSQR